MAVFALGSLGFARQRVAAVLGLSEAAGAAGERRYDDMGLLTAVIYRVLCETTHRSTRPRCTRSR